MNSIKQVNPRLRVAIKLRHLVDATVENWNQLSTIQERVKAELEDASAFMNTYGTSEGKKAYAAELSEINNNIDGLGKMLKIISDVIKRNGAIDLEDNQKRFQKNFTAVENSFSQLENFPENSFKACNYKDWKSIWKVVKSNLLVVKGISEAAYLKIQMMADFNPEELDDLTKTIIKHIPQSFSITEADQYEQDYLEAMEQIEKDANQKDNLWDRFLNLLAGGMPFKQSPAERVMMQRWIDGERGEL